MTPRDEPPYVDDGDMMRCPECAGDGSVVTIGDDDARWEERCPLCMGRGDAYRSDVAMMLDEAAEE